MFFIRSVLSSERTVIAGEQVTYDLPVNPLSFIDLRLTPVANALGASPVLEDILAYVPTVEVLWRGSSIVSASLADVAALVAALTGEFPKQENQRGVASQRTSLTTRIPFGRRRYWGQELLPPVRRGELQLRLTYAATLTRAASLIEHIETVEIPDATPTRFLKYTTFPKTPTAAGDHDVDLPIGNPIIGALLFSTTVPAGATETTSIDALKLLVDNVEFFYSQTRWEELHADFLTRLGPGIADRPSRGYSLSADPASIAANTTGTVTVAVPGAVVGDVVSIMAHALAVGLVLGRALVTSAGVVTVQLGNVTVAAIDDVATMYSYVLWPQATIAALRQYGWLEFDPFVDPELAYALITAGRSRVHLRISADDTAAIRVVPVEMIAIAPRGA